MRSKIINYYIRCLYTIDMLCKLCNKKLVLIGSKRKGGAAHADWNTRKYHKKCWKQKMDFILYEKNTYHCTLSSSSNKNF